MDGDGGVADVRIDVGVRLFVAAGEELARAEGCDGSEGMALEEIETGLGDTEDAAG